jgi:hypothetical protein
MSDFLLVVPEGWTEIADVQVIFATASAESIQADITSEMWWEIEQAIDAAGLLPIGSTVIDAKLFDGGGGWKLWVKYSPST